MVVRGTINRWRKRIAIVLFAGGAITYFGWHAYHGNSGIYAREQVEARVAALEQELASVRAERLGMQRRVQLLRAESLDPDLLEERAREMLSLAHPNDVVVFQRAAEPNVR
jgi:cell division protein FtsB